MKSLRKGSHRKGVLVNCSLRNDGFRLHIFKQEAISLFITVSRQTNGSLEFSRVYPPRILVLLCRKIVGDGNVATLANHHRILLHYARHRQPNAIYTAYSPRPDSAVDG